MGPRVERKDECSPKRALSAEKVVTMLQKRNQVFERVFCADVQSARTAAAAPAAALVQAPRWNLESLLPRGLWHAARIARGDMCMHMWAPRGRLMSISCVPGEVVRQFPFLAFCSELSRHRRRDAGVVALEGCSEFRVQILAYALEGHSRGPLSHFSRSACTIYYNRDTR